MFQFSPYISLESAVETWGLHWARVRVKDALELEANKLGSLLGT